MNDDELRLLIRAAIQRHAAGSAPQAAAESRVAPQLPVIQVSEGGLSFGQYRLERAPGDTSCLIEPAVQCNHCGFCKCHGH
jgi:hypothetical protein